MRQNSRTVISKYFLFLKFSSHTSTKGRFPRK
nr:MAG TPA: hypothetical protein [Caudoviricetes sp.]